MVTALQLCIFAILESWGVKPSSVVGHSSGEIAAAYAAGLLDRAGAIKAAFYRGRAAVNRQHEAEANAGMLAVGLGVDGVAPFVEKYAGSVWIACFNSPSSLPISGEKPALKAMSKDIKAAGHFARLLQVDLAYHSGLMGIIGEEYEILLKSDKKFRSVEESVTSDTIMFSSVTGTRRTDATNALYWKANMVSPVRFADALNELIMQDAPSVIVEIGPSGALAGPVSQVLKSMSGGGADILYSASWARGAGANQSLFNTTGRLFMTGSPIDLAAVNGYRSPSVSGVRMLVDLPNYSWNHTVKYWHENAASWDWWNKQFITHDLLGSKIPGTSWEAPTWRKHLKLVDVPWLRDHKVGPDVLVPGAGLATLAVEAIYQKYRTLDLDEDITSPNELAYRFRNVKFDRAVVVEENKPTTLMLTLSMVPGSKDWHEFRIRTVADGVVYEHCSGLIRIQDPIGDEEALRGDDLAPRRHPQSAKLWYKAQAAVGMGFGPAFQKIESIESASGSRICRAITSMEPPASKWDPQSYYPIRPAVLDGLLQTAIPANAEGERSLINDTMIPALVDDMVINKMPKYIAKGLSVAESIYTGRGRKDVARSWIANIAIHDPNTGALLLRVRGLNCIRLDVDEQPDPHVFHSVSWKPDISLFSSEMVADLAPETRDLATKVDAVLDLIAYKKPILKVLEINLDHTDLSTLWFQGGDKAARVAYAAYDFATADGGAVISVQTAIKSKRNMTFHLLNISEETLGLPATKLTYDLAIVKASAAAGNQVEEVVKPLKSLLSPNAATLLLSSAREDNTTSESFSPSPDSSRPPSQRSAEPLPTMLESALATPMTIMTLGVESSIDYAKQVALSSRELQKIAQNDYLFDSVVELSDEIDNSTAYLCHDFVDIHKQHQPLQITMALFNDVTRASSELFRLR